MYEMILSKFVLCSFINFYYLFTSYFYLITNFIDLTCIGIMQNWNDVIHLNDKKRNLIIRKCKRKFFILIKESINEHRVVRSKQEEMERNKRILSENLVLKTSNYSITYKRCLRLFRFELTSIIPLIIFTIFYVICDFTGFFYYSVVIVFLILFLIYFGIPSIIISDKYEKEFAVFKEINQISDEDYWR